MNANPGSYKLKQKSLNCPAGNSYRNGFTLIEITVVITIVAILAILAIPAIGRVLSNSRTTSSISNLRQLHQAVILYSADHDGNFPVNYYSSTPADPVDIDSIWYDACIKYLYNNQYNFAKGGRRMWYPDGYLDTILHSPNRENDAVEWAPSYGYNETFQRSSSTKFDLLYDTAGTVMFADNHGRTHTLSRTYDAGMLNARNGADGDYSNDGRAAAIFLDGHTELLTSDKIVEINEDANHEFWGHRK
ncbi:MAG: type II secretion system protein [Verrucomicrobiota bacterium]